MTSKGSGAGSVTFGTTSSLSHVKHHQTGSWNASHTYTLYEFVFGQSQGSKALGSPTCANHSCNLTFTSPLNGKNVPNGITIDFELVEN